MRTALMAAAIAGTVPYRLGVGESNLGREYAERAPHVVERLVREAEAKRARKNAKRISDAFRQIHGSLTGPGNPRSVWVVDAAGEIVRGDRLPGVVNR